MGRCRGPTETDAVPIGRNLSGNTLHGKVNKAVNFPGPGLILLICLVIAP